MCIGIDLHSSSCLVVPISEAGGVLHERRLRDDWEQILTELAPNRRRGETNATNGGECLLTGPANGVTPRLLCRLIMAFESNTIATD